jgi:hypothetical protein
MSRDSREQDAVPAELTVRSLRVVNDEGTVVASLGTERDGSVALTVGQQPGVSISVRIQGNTAIVETYQGGMLRMQLTSSPYLGMTIEPYHHTGSVRRLFVGYSPEDGHVGVNVHDESGSRTMRIP